MKKAIIIMLAVLVVGASAYFIMAGGVGGENGKVILCHYPPGNWDNCHTIEVGAAAAEAHLRNHECDHMGACAPGCPCGGPPPLPQQN
ncbi:hypothetical protein JXI42_03680 [bacterium]|nr:hypothetical protein [bacterium]